MKSHVLRLSKFEVHEVSIRSNKASTLTNYSLFHSRTLCVIIQGRRAVSPVSAPDESNKDYMKIETSDSGNSCNATAVQYQTAVSNRTRVAVVTTALKPECHRRHGLCTVSACFS